MAMGTIQNGKGRRGFYNPRYRPMSEINVTPFVDVMLVLLIVFMVTAPLLTVGVPVDLPKTQAASINDDVEPVVLSIKADGQIYIQETPIESDNGVDLVSEGTNVRLRRRRVRGEIAALRGVQRSAKLLRDRLNRLLSAERRRRCALGVS